MRHGARRLAAFVAVLAALGLLAACGGGGSTTPQTHASASTTTTPSLSLAARVRIAILGCRARVTTDTYVPASEVAAAKADCTTWIKHGNAAPLYAILEPACEAAVRAKVPAAQQAKSITACQKAYATSSAG